MNERRLNPLAFPAETNGRFTILIVTAVVLTWLVGFIFLAILVLLTGDEVPLVDTLQSISNASTVVADSDVYIQDLPPETLAVYYENLRAPLVDAWLAGLPWIAVPLGWVLLLLGAAWLIYRTHPKRIRFHHRYDLESSDEASVAEIKGAVRDIIDQVGLLPVPNILIHKLAKVEDTDGQAFGLRNLYQIRFKAQYLFLNKERRPQFQALVLHELGHIANDDIWRTYFALAVWSAFSGILLLMAAILVVFALMRPIGTEFVIFSPWGLLSRIAITLLIAMGIWRSLLQIREFYADWWAASLGQHAPLQQWLERIIINEKPWWQLLNPFHPSAKERAEVLAEPLKLFRINRQLPFLTGLLLSITMIGFPIMVGWLFLPFIGLIEIGLVSWAPSLFGSPNPGNVNLFLLANFVFKGLPLFLLISGVLIYIGYLLTKTIGVQVQRETIADMENRVIQLRSYGRLAKPAIWLTLGIQTGLFLIPTGYAFPTNWEEIALAIGWLFLFSLMTWLWLAYIRALTQIVLGAHVGRTDPKRGKRLITILSSLSLAVLYPPAFLLLFLAWISRYALSLPLSSGSNELSSAGFMAVSFAVLFLLAIVWFLGAVLSLIILYGILASSPSSICPACGEQLVPKIVLGQTCTYCHQPIARWIYLEEKRDVVVR